MAEVTISPSMPGENAKQTSTQAAVPAMGHLSGSDSAPTSAGMVVCTYCCTFCLLAFLHFALQLVVCDRVLPHPGFSQVSRLYDAQQYKAPYDAS